MFESLLIVIERKFDVTETDHGNAFTLSTVISYLAIVKAPFYVICSVKGSAFKTYSHRQLKYRITVDRRTDHPSNQNSESILKILELLLAVEGQHTRGHIGGQ